MNRSFCTRALVSALAILGVVVCSAACSEPDWAGTDSDDSPTTPAASDDDCTDDDSSAATTSGAGAGAGTACCEDLLPGKAHCVDESEVSASSRSSLASCPSGGLCVPDSLHQHIAPAPCDSKVAGDGVCVSLCVKAIADKANLLQQSTCAKNEVCAPCVNPLDGNKPTGACDLGKTETSSFTFRAKKPCTKKTVPDAGAATHPVSDKDAGASGSTTSASTACCSGKGACVPKAAVPAAQVDHLEQKECAEANLCAPKENIDPNFKPKTCTGKSLTGSYTGVCLSNCLTFDFLESAISGQGDCDADHRCLPCKTPFGTDTGAPGCN